MSAIASRIAQRNICGWTGYAILLLTITWTRRQLLEHFKVAGRIRGGESYPPVARAREIFGRGVPVMLVLAAMVFCMNERRSLKILLSPLHDFRNRLHPSSQGLLGVFGNGWNAGGDCPIRGLAQCHPAFEYRSHRAYGKVGQFSRGSPWNVRATSRWTNLPAVVFSRATAVEVRRRSDILRPLADPSWQILSHITQLQTSKGASGAPANLPTKPLTASILVNVCADPQLDFVIAQESVGYEPLRHQHAGPWKDWNLYDCRKTRLQVPST